MSLQKFQYSFQELDVTISAIETLMGYATGALPEHFREITEEVFSVAPAYCSIQGGFTIKGNISIDRANSQLSVDGILFTPQKIVINQIKQAEQLAFFLCTAGEGISRWSKQLMNEGDLLKGYIADAVGSQIVESAADKMQNQLEEQMAQQGLRITNRYSPGYCEWNVVEQHKLFRLFPEQPFGISLTEGALMFPVKSVSGIIGIGRNVKRNNHNCQICEVSHCIYRNRMPSS